MALLLRPAPDYRPAPIPVPALPPRSNQPMLDFAPPAPPTVARTPAEPDPLSQLARGVGFAVVEVLAGRRPAGQLHRWAHPEVVGQLNLIARRRRGLSLRLASVRTQRTRPGVLEVSLRVELAPDWARSAAMALQLRRREGRWLCHVLEVGPELSLSGRGTS